MHYNKIYNNVLNITNITKTIQYATNESFKYETVSAEKIFQKTVKGKQLFLQDNTQANCKKSMKLRMELEKKLRAENAAVIWKTE